MPMKIDPAVKERTLRMVAEHRGEYSSLTACCAPGLLEAEFSGVGLRG